jgi:hypothetical protein
LIPRLVGASPIPSTSLDILQRQYLQALPMVFQ